MWRALALARRGMGETRPNPPVGAVLVKDGVVVGEGFHPRAGGPHAEVVALEAAGERARGATLYVTLEPCNHQGRTPPCAPALVERGVSRVHYAIEDPNPVSAGGAEALRRAGVEVHRGPLRQPAAHLLAGFASLTERKRPRFSLKVAVSLDGRLAIANGDSRWITSMSARAWVHRRRREADAILVGAGTVRRDNPALTTRLVRGHTPDRFVVDSKLSVRPDARIWNADGARRVAVTTEAAPEAARQALEAQGVEVWSLPAGDDGRVPLRAFAARLGEEGYTNLLCEGGGVLAGSLFASHLVDVAWVMIAPNILLGGGGPGWTEGLRVPAVARGLRLARRELRPMGPDLLMTLVPESAQWWAPEVVAAGSETGGNAAHPAEAGEAKHV